MSIRLIDKPEFRNFSDYGIAIEEMVSRLKKIDGVKSIYQIGSVSNPGISDIDMLVVFENGFKVSSDPIRDHQTDTYLFTHQLYGVSVQYWSALRSLTFFHNYRLIHGEAMPELQDQLTADEQTALKRQIALEFLIKMHMVLTVQLRYNIVKLRSFLLEGKALIYDLEFLNITEGGLHEQVQRIMEWRTTWFGKTPTDREIEELLRTVHRELENLLRTEFGKHTFFLPNASDQHISKNTVLRNGSFHTQHSGIGIPKLGIIPNRKYFNLLHRFNSFQFFMPFVQPDKDHVINARFELLCKLKDYNQINLPGFLIPASSLKII